MNDEQKQNTDESTDDHDDVEIEQDEFVLEDGEGNTQDTVQRLREKLKKAVAEKQEYLDGWQRAKAEFVNARKRDEESRREMMKFANESLIADLIPVLESFEMARANKEAWEAIDKNWRMGVEHIQNQLLKTLQDNGLTEINPRGERFDPMRDEAVSNELVTDEKLDHTIVEVLQKGYSLDGKIIKAPRVKVGEYKKPE